MTDHFQNEPVADLTGDRAPENQWAGPGEHLTVNGFCVQNEAGLQALCRELSLPEALPVLFYMQSYFAGRLRRDPTVGEVRLTVSLAGALTHLPEQWFFPAEIPGCAELSDIRQKEKEMGKPTARTPHILLSRIGTYLSRAGITPAFQTGMIAGESAEIAAACHGMAPELALEFAGVTGVLLPLAETRKNHVHGALLEFTCEEREQATERLAALCRRHIGLPLSPLFAGKPLGLLPALAQTDGADIELSQISGYRPGDGTQTLVRDATGRFYLSVPEGNLPALLRAEPELKQIGRLTGNGILRVTESGRKPAELTVEFLSRLYTKKEEKKILPAEPTGAPEDERVIRGRFQILVGNRTAGDPMEALLSLLLLAAENGAVPETLTLCPVLDCPADAGDAACGALFSFILACHRFSAELMIPPVNAKILLRPAGTAAALTLFLSGTRREIPAPKTLARLREATKRRDFAAIRQIFTENL